MCYRSLARAGLTQSLTATCLSGQFASGVLVKLFRIADEKTCWATCAGYLVVFHNQETIHDLLETIRDLLEEGAVFETWSPCKPLAVVLADAWGLLSWIGGGA